MQGVILAAGKGTRLRPLTLTRSKALMPIAGQPIVARVMELLVAGGVNDFILVISPNDREITRYFQTQTHLEIEVRFVYQAKRKGMAHALMQAAPLISEDFVLSACDNLVSPASIAQIMDFWAQAPQPNAALTLMHAPLERIYRGATVGLDGDWITRIIEKPPPEAVLSDLASLPLYLFALRVLDYLPEVPESPRGEYELQDAIQMLIAREGRVGGVVLEGRVTLTTPADLLALNRDYVRRDAVPVITPDAVGENTRITTPVRIEAGVRIGADCTIGPNVYLESGCRIGDGVTLRDAVILRDQSVADGQRVVGEVRG